MIKDAQCTDYSDSEHSDNKEEPSYTKSEIDGNLLSASDEYEESPKSPECVLMTMDATEPNTQLFSKGR